MKFKSKQYGKNTVLVSDQGNIFTGETGRTDTFREKFFYYQPKLDDNNKRTVINLRELYQELWVKGTDTSEIIELNTAEFFKVRETNKELNIETSNEEIQIEDNSIEKWKNLGDNIEVSNFGNMRKYGMDETPMNGDERYSIPLIGGIKNTRRSVLGATLVYKTFRPNENILSKKVHYKDGNSFNCHINNLQFLNPNQIEALESLEFVGPTLNVPKDIFEKLINFNRKIMMENMVLRNKIGLTAIPEKIINDIYDLYENLK